MMFLSLSSMVDHLNILAKHTFLLVCLHYIFIWFFLPKMSLVTCNLTWKTSSSPDSSYWNRKIKDKLVKGNAEQAIQTYVKMQELGVYADNYTFPILLKAAGNLSGSCLGLMIQGQAIKSGYYNHVFVQTAMLDMYGALRCTESAYNVFEKMPVKDIVAWNSMLGAFVSCGQMDNAMELFDSLDLKDLRSFNIMVSGYAKMGKTQSARSIFDRIPVKDVVSWNSMLLAYTNAREMEAADEIFKQISDKNIITWNTMINGYVQSQLYAEAVDLFDEMIIAKFKPDNLTLSAVLSACANSGSLETGIRVHINAMDNELAFGPHITTALIDMYAKCGNIEQSLLIFHKFQMKDIYCWNAIISGLALHGYGYSALKLLDQMKDNSIKPDDITFIGLLSGCSHSGLVKQGSELFTLMEKNFGITPKIEHYGCMVDLLGRAGFLRRAIQVIETMPFEPTESIWGALLSASVVHQELEIGDRIVKLVCDRTSHLADGELMMFANLYASCNQWEEAKRWRNMMDDMGIDKTAGWSAIEINGRYHKFLAGGVRPR